MSSSRELVYRREPVFLEATKIARPRDDNIFITTKKRSLFLLTYINESQFNNEQVENEKCNLNIIK